MAISVATLAWYPGTNGVEERGFRDAAAYWAAPLSIEGDAQHQDPATLDLAPRACGVCHPRQYEDWHGSRHAQAVSPGLLGQLDALSFGERRRCFACHVPAAERQVDWETRESDTVPELHGVDCATCHVRGRQRFGPRERPTTPHGVVEAADFFRSSEFCAPCHQFGPDAIAIHGKPLENTHAEWAGSRYAREGRTCQSCHMSHGSHRFAGIHDPAMTARALRVTAVRTASGVEVTVGNIGAGHALPTYAVPRIRVSVIAAGQTKLDYAIQRQMHWDAENGWRERADTRLMPGQEITLSQSLPAEAQAAVTLSVEPDADYFERVYPAMIDLLAGEVPLSDIEHLQEAQRRAGESPYRLVRMSCAAFGGETAPCIGGAGPSDVLAGSESPALSSADAVPGPPPVSPGGAHQ